jgi:hypothetical protein
MILIYDLLIRLISQASTFGKLAIPKPEQLELAEKSII